MPQKILLSLIPLCFLSLSCTLERPDRSFVNWGAIVWRGEIRINANHHIASGDILVIEPGTVVRFTATNADLLVEGGFVCGGTADEPVRFVADGPSGNSVIVFGEDNSQNKVTWTSFGDNTLDLRTFCAVGHSSAAKIIVSNPDRTVRPVIRDSLVGYVETRDDSEPIFASCRFDRASFPSLAGGEKNLSVFDASVLSATNSEILGNTAIASPASGLTVEVTASALLRKNWWGTSSGTYVTNTLLFRSIPGQTVYLPILSAARSAPAVP